MPAIEILPPGPPGWPARLHYALIRAAQQSARLAGGSGLHSASVALARLFGRAHYVDAGIGAFIFRVGLHDPYWLHYILGRQFYEPEIWRLLASLPERPALFLDCGANAGWWSLIAEKEFGYSCIAVEPAPDLAEALERNKALKQARFRIVRRAILDVDEKQVTFLTDKHEHAAGHIDGVANVPRLGSTIIQTSTVTIDRIVAEWLASEPGAPPRDLRIIVKLDVEGAEEAAIRGARETLHSRDCILIYEDHGGDADCATSRVLLTEGFSLYKLDGLAGPRPVRSLEAVRAVKRDRSIGYNFAAVRTGSESYMELQHIAQAGASHE